MRWRLQVLLLLTIMGAAGCANPRAPSKAPDHEAMVLAHLDGRYQDVIEWCPVVLGEPRSGNRAMGDWCLFALPAALWLSLDFEAALTFVRAACVDVPTDTPIGDDEFRRFYVREVSRWVALPLRAQKREAELAEGLSATIIQLSTVCRVDPGLAALGLDTTIH